MSHIYGTREPVRNPSLFRIDPRGSFEIEDKKIHTKLGVYLGRELAAEFFALKERIKDKLASITSKEMRLIENGIIAMLGLDRSGQE